jgi:hypothetical protein
MRSAVPDAFAACVISWVLFVIWLTEPAAEAISLQASVWMESMTTRSAASDYIVVAISLALVEVVRTKSLPPAPSLEARIATCSADSSPLI